jgi:putative ribosome biogenesis GTPase RsgA
VKTSEKHRHGQALLAMSVFAFWGQDGVGKTRLSVDVDCEIDLITIKGQL